ncbi:MAG: arsenic resistance protein [Candidatus Aminicenantes bacterium]|nr:arsenic resistance protein [Candidatus Aminicenantes bacterium]
MVSKMDSFVKKNLVWFVLLSLVVGFVAGLFYSKAIINLLKSLIIPSAFLMLWASMIDLQIRKFVDSIKYPKKLLLGNFLALVVAPLMMLPLALIFAKEPKMFAGLMLAGIAPPGGFITYWTMILNANMGLAVSLTLTTFLVSLVWIPYGMKILVGGKVNVNVAMLFKKVLLLVVGPFILAVITRMLILKTKGEKGLKKARPYYHLISSLMALFLVFSGVSLKSKFILAHTARVILPAGGALFYYLLAYPVTYYLLKWIFKISLDDAIPLVYGTATKNLSIAMGLAAAAFGPLTLLGVVSCVIFQMPLASMWYKVFLRVKEGEKFAIAAEEEAEELEKEIEGEIKKIESEIKK